MDIKKRLDQNLSQYRFKSEINKEKNQLRYFNPITDLGVTLDLNILEKRFQQDPEQATGEIAHFIKNSLIIEKGVTLVERENQIFPVIRSSSFPKENKQGKRFIIQEHTAETCIYFALDNGNSYQLIDEELFATSQIAASEMYKQSLSNLRSILFTHKKDIVAGNDFYFIHQNDGYDASRILLTNFLDKMRKLIRGVMTVSVPHQDVLIIGDIQNDTGYDVLAHMCMKFFTEGNVPITSLSFLYEKGELEPIFILAKNTNK